MRYGSEKRLVSGGAALVMLALAAAAAADPIETAGGNTERAEFDIVRTEIARDGDNVLFRMRLSGEAGVATPTPTGQLAGSEVLSYVWPTSLNSSAVGFEPDQGILALAATSHPDFDDTPLEDENGDGDVANDGLLWHSHWVVLGPDEACGPGALKVQDIPEGATPQVPDTWPNLPIFIDSPGYVLELAGPEITIPVPASVLGEAADVSFDGVTAALRVNASVHAPLLCVTDVFDVASGDLSLPGRVAD